MKKINVSDITIEGKRQHIIESNFDKNGGSLSIKYPAIFESTKILREFIIDIADYLHFEGLWKTRLTLIADELNNNGIEYGSIKSDINKMMLKISIIDNEAELILEIEDSGNGANSKTADEMNKEREKKKNKSCKTNGIRGRGLYLIITRLVDELYFKDSKNGGLIVGIKKKFEIE